MRECAEPSHQPPEHNHQPGCPLGPTSHQPRRPKAAILLSLLACVSPCVAAVSASEMAREVRDLSLDPEECYRVRDMSLAKDFHLNELKYFNFRWDVFNALNHQNLGVPNSSWCLPPGPNGQLDSVHVFGCSFGQITNIQTDPREMQFSFKFYW